MSDSVYKKLLTLDLCVGIFGFLLVYFNLLPRMTVIIFFIIFAVGAYCCAALCPPTVKDYVSKHKKGFMLLATGLGLLTVIAVCLVPVYVATLTDGILSDYYLRVYKYAARIFPADQLMGYYTAQLSLTFISISVMSVLSDKSVTIYWSNVSRDRLISPVFSCFAAYTYYSIAATVGAGIGILNTNCLLFAICFIINIALLILLTVSIIDVYYGRDTKIEQLAEELEADYYKRFPNTENLSDRKKKREEFLSIKHRTEYARKMVGLAENTYKAIGESDFKFLQEVYELYGYKHHLFISDEGAYPVEAMVSSLDDHTFGFFAAEFDKISVSFLKITEEVIEEDLREGYNVDDILNKGDDILWETFSKNEFFLNKLAQTPYSNKEYNDFYRYIRWIKRRLAAEYDFYAARYIAAHPDCNPDDYLLNVADNQSCTATIRSTNKPIDYEIFEKVVEFTFLTNYFNQDLMVSMARMLGAMFKDPEFKKGYLIALNEIPFIPYLVGGRCDCFQWDGTPWRIIANALKKC